jgi:simple sugar transport system permease protein
MVEFLRHRPTEAKLLIVFALVCLGLSLATDSFLTLVNLTSLLNNSAINLIWAV